MSADSADVVDADAASRMHKYSEIYEGIDGYLYCCCQLNSQLKAPIYHKLLTPFDCRLLGIVIPSSQKPGLGKPSSTAWQHYHLSKYNRRSLVFRAKK